VSAKSRLSRAASTQAELSAFYASHPTDLSMQWLEIWICVGQAPPGIGARHDRRAPLSAVLVAGRGDEPHS
jgi:hypothetical protein